MWPPGAVAALLEGRTPNKEEVQLPKISGFGVDLLPRNCKSHVSDALQTTSVQGTVESVKSILWKASTVAEGRSGADAQLVEGLHL